MTKHCQMNTKGADDFLSEFPVRYEYNTFFVVVDADVCLFVFSHWDESEIVYTIQYNFAFKKDKIIHQSKTAFA